MGNHPGFITIHGIDGTGKSTLVDAVMERWGECGLPCIKADDLNDQSPWARTKNGFAGLASQERLYFKLGSKASQGIRISEVLDADSSVIKDRWVIDVMADEAFNGARIPEKVFDTILTPDLAILLTCDEDVRMARILSRDDPTEEDTIPVRPGTRAHFFQEFLRDNLQYSAKGIMELDTTKNDPYDLANLVFDKGTLI